MSSKLVLAIESSCDDSCVAVVDCQRRIVCDFRNSQAKEHEPHGGVVPEIAARSHMAHLSGLVKKCNVDFKSLLGIAATGGPGLLGGLVTGVSFAKAMAAALSKPFIAINHLEGHALTIRLTNNLNYPYLLLLVSGGHCQFVAVLSLGCYKILGNTLDDSLGEAFDKLAKMLGLGYPGGPLIEKLALTGNVNAFKMPKPMIDRDGCDFSFSGIKTFLKNLIADLGPQICVEDVCASFQHTMATVLCARLGNAIKLFRALTGKSYGTVVLSGGVAANLYIRDAIEEGSVKLGFDYAAPPVSMCTDNAGMIAWAAQERFAAGQSTDLNFVPKSKWSLET